MLARGARKLLRVSEDAVAVAILGRVLVLRIDDRLQHLDYVELVLPDPAREELVLAGGGIEPPLLAALDDRERERIVVAAHDERRLVAIALNRVLGLVRGDEALARRTIRDGVARRDPVARIAEHRENGGTITGLQDLHERAHGVVGRRERLLRDRSRCGIRREQQRGDEREH